MFQDSVFQKYYMEVDEIIISLLKLPLVYSKGKKRQVILPIPLWFTPLSLNSNLYAFLHVLVQTQNSNM